MKLGNYTVETSSEDKVLFPASGITKGDLINYYVSVADHFIRHARNRPLAMHRFPNGIQGQGFFQKDKSDYFPEWIDFVDVEKEEGGVIKMLTVNKKATLAYIANQGCIAPHIWLSRRDKLHYPDKMIFDMDPPQGNFQLALEAAKAMRIILEKAGMKPFVMTTGSKGLHVVVPLKRSKTFDEVREKARNFCEQLEAQHPNKFTTEIRKDKREGRLFLDYLRNAYGQHGIAPYGVRAIEHAPVATPLEWEELDALPNGSQSWNIGNVVERLSKKGDPWKNIFAYAVKV